jgi:uncharacterized protein
MNRDLSYLPQNKRDELQQIVGIIREHCPAAGMVILFGSYARGDWKEQKDLAPDRKSGHPSDYDILVLTEDEYDCDSTELNTINNTCLNARLSATARVIHHDIGFMNRKLETGRYFFTDIVSEGRILFDDDSLTLSDEKVLTPVERLEIVQNDFDHWFERAYRFFEFYKMGMEKRWLKEGAFHLHQTAETAYKTTLIVFTNYIPDEHYLALLGERAAAIDPGLRDVFHGENSFEHEAFTALEYAYIGARYDKRYVIDEASLIYLAERVELLLKHTEAVCRQKIAELREVVG